MRNFPKPFARLYFIYFATMMRELADQYDKDAEFDEHRDPFEEYS